MATTLENPPPEMPRPELVTKDYLRAELSALHSDIYQLEARLVRWFTLALIAHASMILGAVFGMLKVMLP